MAGKVLITGKVSGARAATRRPRGFHIGSVFRHRQAHSPRLGSRKLVLGEFAYFLHIHFCEGEFL
jgi:hypothetical protein